MLNGFLCQEAYHPDIIEGTMTVPPLFYNLMEKEKLKLIVRNLRLLVDALESEVYSDVESYTL